MIRTTCSAPRRAALVSALIASSLGLSACASAGDYPSLARRPAEQVAGAEPETPQAPPPAPATPGLSTRLSALVERAQGAHGRFQSRQDQARHRIAGASGASVGSENWAVATVALADLEAVRSEAMIALAELDALHVADRVANPNQPSEDAAPIAAARNRVIAWIAEEDAVLTRLRGAIR